MFMNLNLGRIITRTSWNPVPMPCHFVDRVHQLADNQPRGIEFRDRNNQMIPDYEENNYVNKDDYTYDPSEGDSDSDDDTGAYPSDDDTSINNNDDGDGAADRGNYAADHENDDDTADDAAHDNDDNSDNDDDGV